MKSCMFCKNTRVFDVHKDYGNNGHTVKDDMIEFFGHQIENHLRPRDAVCNMCMNIMEKVAKLKRMLLPFIFRLQDTEDFKPLKLGSEWNVFASMNLEDATDHYMESRTPSPNELLECKRIEPYFSPVEKRKEEIVRSRSESRPKSVGARSDTTNRRKRRGHNWSRRKNGRYSRMSGRKSVTSNYSRTSRPISSMSTWSYPTTDHDSPYPVTAEDEVDSYEESNIAIENIRICYDETILHECTEPDCQFLCENIDLMANHKISKHKHLALFWCTICEKKYTSSDELKVHNRVHLEQRPCAICKREFYEDELRDHWQEHFENSVPCEYCGKRFLDKKVCNRHKKAFHMRDQRSRVDFKINNVESNAEGQEFMVKILVQDVDFVAV